MSEAELMLVNAMLKAAGYDESQVAWMGASCPSVDACRYQCKHRPSQDALEIDAAHKLYQAVADSDDEERKAKAKAYLELVVGRVKAKRGAL